MVMARTGASAGRLGLAGSGREDIVLEPLMPSIDGTAHTVGLGIAEGERTAWHTVTSKQEDARPWDICHQLLSDGFGRSGYI